MQLDQSKIDATLAAIPQARRPDGTISRAELGRLLGIDARNAERRLKRLAENGLLGFDPVLPGFAVKRVSSQIDAETGLAQKHFVQQERERGPEFAVPSGHMVKGVSALLDGEGRTLQSWVKTSKTQIDPLEIAEKLTEHFEHWRPEFAPKADATANDNFEESLTLLPWSDPHFGLRTWAGDTPQNWDLKIAVKTFTDTFAKVISRCPRTKRAILLVGGDTTHADNNSNTTPNSGHHLDVDGRHPKVFLTACETIVTVVNMALDRFQEVEVINLIGNHNETSADPISFFLHAWFRNDDRVAVDTTSHLFKFRRYGKCMLGFTHGHAAKAKDMHTIMSHYEPKMWGLTEHRAAHVFHVHHQSKYVSEMGGCVTETHQIMAPADAWHFGQGYKAGRSQQAIIYDKNHGEVSRIRVSVC